MLCINTHSQNAGTAFMKTNQKLYQSIYRFTGIDRNKESTESKESMVFNNQIESTESVR